MVEGQTVGKSQVVFYKDGPIRPIHVGRLNFRPVPVPVCPVQPPEPTEQTQLDRPVNHLKKPRCLKRILIVRHSPVRRVGYDGSGVDQIGVKQDPAMAAIQFRNLHRVTH